MEGMTEEQKEHEAMKLVNMFDKLSRYVAWQGGTPGWDKGERTHVLSCGPQEAGSDSCKAVSRFVIARPGGHSPVKG